MLTKMTMACRRPVFQGGSILDRPSILKIMIALTMMMISTATAADSFRDFPRTLNGDYCRLRPGAERNKCCGGRLDQCSVPILDTLCYCDEFCDRDDNDDCCPDYWSFCRGEPTPEPILGCFYKGTYYQVGQTIPFNCNQCTCTALTKTNAEMVCEDRGCLVRPHVIQTINQGNYGWRASNYSFFWGKSLDEGYEKRLGVCKPESSVIDQSSVHQVMNGELMELEFDARRKWPGWIQPIHDQGDFPSSWAVSTVDLGADRLAIQSHGMESMTLSAQNLVSCVTNRNNHCPTGSTDRAWWHLSVFGVVSDDCYPYTSGSTGTKDTCLIQRNQRATKSNCPRGRRESMLYRSTPAYRVSEKQEEIMKEIKTNGPVQAIFKVKDDFFLYKSGVYRHTRVGNQRDHHHRHPFHAVRIIGWGIDRSHGSAPTDYWLCANSWGTDWGENGYFRIVRGQNECDIEMFVVGAWANTQLVHNGHLMSNNI